MKLKSVYYLFLLSFFPLFGFSQNGFIEVEVSESIVLKPVSFEYSITISNDYNYAELVEEIDSVEDNEVINDIKKKDEIKKKLNELENFLKLKKYNYTSLEETNLEVGKANLFSSSDGFKVKVNSLEALQKLVREIKDMKNIQGSVLETYYEDSSNHDAALLKKILDKAKLEAQAIATGTNLTLGRIIEVKEIKESDTSNQNFIEMIKGLSTRRYFLDQNTQGKPYYKGYVIKFKAE